MLGDETVTRIIQNNLKGYVFTDGTHPSAQRGSRVCGSLYLIRLTLMSSE